MSPCGLLVARVALATAPLLHAAGAGEPWQNRPGSGLVKYAAWSVLAEQGSGGEGGSGGLVSVIGQVQKHPENPLLVQDKPWDARWDNGYPNVEHTPGSPHGEFRLWYGGFVTLRDSGPLGRENAWHYANSSDGLVWEKPELGIVDLAKAMGATPAMIAAGTRNNVLMLESDGMGLLLDRHEPNRSSAFKSVGTGCFDQRAVGRCLSGSAASADGLHWADAEPIRWSKPHGWDDHQNFFFDPALGRYVLTTRLWLPSGAGNAGGVGEASPPEEAGPLERTIAVSLGAADGSFGGWSDPALTMRGSAAQQPYSQVTWRYYNVYLGIVMVFDARAPTTVGTVRCRLAWAPAPLGPWRWVAKDGLTGPELPPIAGPDVKAFDSHVCFAAHLPLVVGGEIRLYYMGGDGPHNARRNSSLGLATLRPDGFAGVGPPGSDQPARASTEAILVTGATLVVTADIAGSGGFVCVGVPGHPALDPSRCRPVAANATDEALRFEGGADFGALLGQRVALELVLHRAVLYTFGFAARAAPRLVV